MVRGAWAGGLYEDWAGIAGPRGGPMRGASLGVRDGGKNSWPT